MFLRDCSTLIAVAISVIILLFYQYKSLQEPDESYNMQPTISETMRLAIKLLGLAQFVMSIALILGYCINKTALILKSEWRAHAESMRINNAQIASQLDQLT